MTRKRLQKIAIYGAFTALAFIVNLYLTLPAEAVAQRLAYELHRHSAGAWTLTYSSASRYRLSGVQLRDVRLVHQDDSDVPPTPLHLDWLSARLRLSPLLLASTSVQLQAGAGAGEVAVTYSQGRKKGSLSAAISDLDLHAWALSQSLVGLGSGGLLQGSVQASWDAAPQSAVASASLSLKNGAVGPGTVAGFTLPQIALGELQMGAHLEEGKLELTQFKQSGGALALKARGSAQARLPLPATSLDVCLQVQLDPTFLQANPKMKTVLQLAEVQLKKDPQGFLHIPLSGPLGAVRLGRTLCR